MLFAVQSRINTLGKRVPYSWAKLTVQTVGRIQSWEAWEQDYLLPSMEERTVARTLNWGERLSNYNEMENFLLIKGSQLGFE